MHAEVLWQQQHGFCSVVTVHVACAVGCEDSRVLAQGM